MLQLEYQKIAASSRIGKSLPIPDPCPIIVEDSHLEPPASSPSGYSVCHLCARRFTRNHHLERHLLGHANRNNFECRGKGISEPGSRWGCKKGFKTALDLYNHFQSDRGRRCIAQLLADEGLQVFREGDKPSPSFHSVAVSSEMSLAIYALPLPTLLLRQIPELQQFEQLANLDHSSHQSIGSFTSRYNSTSSRSSKKSGISDEGYHTADGDFDTSSADIASTFAGWDSSKLTPDNNHHLKRTAATHRDGTQPYHIFDVSSKPSIPRIPSPLSENSEKIVRNFVENHRISSPLHATFDTKNIDQIDSTFYIDSPNTVPECFEPPSEDVTEEGQYGCIRCGQRFIHLGVLEHHKATSPFCGRRVAPSHSREYDWEATEPVFPGQAYRSRVFSPCSDPPTELEWESVHKDVHHCLVERGLTVDEVQCWLNVMRDFRVTEQMVESQLSIWGYDIVNKTKEQHQSQSRGDAVRKPSITSNIPDAATATAALTRSAMSEQTPNAVVRRGSVDTINDVKKSNSEVSTESKRTLAFRPPKFSKRLRLRKETRSVSDIVFNKSDLSATDTPQRQLPVRGHVIAKASRPDANRPETFESRMRAGKEAIDSQQLDKNADRHQLEFLLSKQNPGSTNCKTGPNGDLPSPALSKSTNKPNNNSDSELSFIGTNSSFRTDRQFLDQPDDETQHFITQLASRIVCKYVDLTDRNAIRSHITSHGSNSSSQPSGSNSKGTPTTTSSIPSKRARQDGGKENDSQEDDEGSDPPESKRKRCNANTGTKLFACPYAKFDPERYSERNHSEKRYRKCNSKYLNSITRVKQHLYRTHARPSWYCGNCYESFESREGLNEHTRRRPPCERAPAMYDEMMTDDQFQAVKRRSAANDPFESWFKIFEILFPETARPLSPYVSTCDPTTVAHFVSFFRRCGPEELLNLMRDRREQNGERSIQLTASTQAIVDEAFEIALPDYLERLEGSPEVQSETAAATTMSTTATTTTRSEHVQHTITTHQGSSISTSSSPHHSDHRHPVPSTYAAPAGPTAPLCDAQDPSHSAPYMHAHGWPAQATPFIQHALHAIGEPVDYGASLGPETDAEDMAFLDPSQVDRAFDAYETSAALDVADDPAGRGSASYEWVDPPGDVHNVELSMDMQWQYLRRQ